MMSNLFNEDFIDFLAALNRNEVRYILVGGYSVILHGYSRTTGDMDIWVEKSEENYKKLTNAFSDFKMPLFDMTLQNFIHNPKVDVFTFGRPPVCIDIMTSVKGLEFKEAFDHAEYFTIHEEKIRVIHYQHLIKAKKTSGRWKDLDDIENLEKS
jgi:hypothetical protein